MASRAPQSNRFTTAFILATILVFAAIVGFSTSIKADAPGGDVGQRAPSLARQMLGTTDVFDDSQLDGSPVIVNFWASWCPPCNEEAPALAAAYEKWAPNGVKFIGVDSTDETSGGLAFIKNYGWTYPVVIDPDGAMQTQWGLDGLPATFFISRSGEILHVHSGAIDAETLNANIKALVASK